MATKADGIIKAAVARGQKTLSEYDSKRVLAAYGVPVSRETLVSNLTQARAAARRLGYPVVLKACAADATHKTEKGLVAVNLASERALGTAFRTIEKRAGRRYDGECDFSHQPPVPVEEHGQHDSYSGQDLPDQRIIKAVLVCN